jgi:hypothetical protein
MSSSSLDDVFFIITYEIYFITVWTQVEYVGKKVLRVQYCRSVTIQAHQFSSRPVNRKLLWHTVREIRMEIILLGGRLAWPDPSISDLSQSAITVFPTPLFHPQLCCVSTTHMTEI